MKAKMPKPGACGYPAALMACPDFVLSTLSLTVTELIEEALAPFDLRLRHYRLMRLLYFDGPQLQTAVGAALRTDRTTVVALIDALEQKKLAKRTRSREDRRSYHVALTAKGERIVRDATAKVNAVEDSMFAPLDPGERAELRRVSMRLLSEPGPIAQAGASAGDSDT